MLRFLQNSVKPFKNSLKGLFLSLFLSPTILWSAAYYVNGVSGIDANNGTTTTPLKTINAALAKVNSGDTILIASAVYRESLSLPCSNITLRAQPNADVRIKGSNLITNWTLYSNAIWQTPWTINSQQVFVDSVPLQQIGANSPLQTTLKYGGEAVLPPVGKGLSDMTAGSFYFDTVASKLYVWLKDSSDPRKHTLEASVRNVLIPSDESLQNVKLIDLKFYHSNMTATGNTLAIVNVAGMNWVVTHCVFNDGDFGGLQVQGTGHRITNCTIDRNGNVGLKITGSDKAHLNQPWPERPAQNIIVNGCQTNNNNYRHFNSQWGAGGMKNVPSCRQVTITKCVSRYNDGAGIWFDIGAHHNVIDKCTVTDNKGSGIFYEISDYAVITNNLVLRNGKRDGEAGISVSASDSVYVTNNTIHGNYAGVFVAGVPRIEHPSLANNSIKNNIISLNTSLDLVMHIDSTTAPLPGNGNSSDYNLFYRGDNLVKIIYTKGGGKIVNYQNLTTLAAATGMEQNSLVGDPLFAAPEANNFSLTAASPAIGTAIFSSAPGSLDNIGLPRKSGSQLDMGAFELQTIDIKSFIEKRKDRDAYVYFLPVVSKTPVIRAVLSDMREIEFTIYNVAGRAVYNKSISTISAGKTNEGQTFYDCPCPDIPSGHYYAVIHGVFVNGATVETQTKFAIVR